MSRGYRSSPPFAFQSITYVRAISMPLFFGFVGIINIFLLWPFGVLLHYTGIERFEWPSGNALIIGLLINAAITL